MLEPNNKKPYLLLENCIFFVFAPRVKNCVQSNHDEPFTWPLKAAHWRGLAAAAGSLLMSAVRDIAEDEAIHAERAPCIQRMAASMAAAVTKSNAQPPTAEKVSCIELLSNSAR